MDPNACETSSVEDLLQNVSSALAHHRSVFAIEGHIESQQKLTIRWDAKIKGFARTLRLPLTDDATQESLGLLLNACQPATFGFGNQEVLDEEYRKAGKMDPNDFCTDFNPYEHGIVDTINQALAQGSHSAGKGLGVKAELYKLNVYSAPSGKFKPHVDTPRSDRQMGSLVVCLPVAHKGGQLAVRHGGREVLCDWASRSPDTIQWAAFFSDCEHEVCQVTEGHRVTLTYNLFWTDYGPASMADHLGCFDQESLHFYASLEKLIGKMKSGKDAMVGFTCTHAYPHTSSSSAKDLRHMLKGMDMAVYQALKRILGDASIAAVFGSDYRDRFYVAKRPISPIVDPDYDMEDESAPDLEYWYDLEQVTWLNHRPDRQTSKELSVAYLTYGNEPGMGTFYSSAVVVAKIKGSVSNDGGNDEGNTVSGSSGDETARWTE
ncbi:hypothetical protein LB507_005760 [Fusarium sp. FIESC RH6]|nr:hypothetical protein LB507_005760 [Fusarium sp. FIESC RH6]